MILCLDEEYPAQINKELPTLHIKKYHEMEKVFGKVYYSREDFKSVEPQLQSVLSTVPHPKELYDLVVQFNREYC